MNFKLATEKWQLSLQYVQLSDWYNCKTNLKTFTLCNINYINYL